MILIPHSIKNFFNGGLTLEHIFRQHLQFLSLLFGKNKNIKNNILSTLYKSRNFILQAHAI